MSKYEIDGDGFRIVKSKRFSQRKPTKVPRSLVKFEKENIKIDIQRAKRQIQAAIDELKSSKYLEAIIKSLNAVFLHKDLKEIICFGLGHIGECHISRYQLALLLCIKDKFKPQNVFVHDPIFYTSECELLHVLELNVIEENCEGCYITSDNDICLVYLPHCPKQLTNNFLWSNWSVNLHNCLLLCNSFTSLIENHPSRTVLESVPYIHKIYPHVKETVLENNFTYTDIFNDTSLHIICKEKLEKLNSEFWVKGDKPNYDNAEEFVTRLMIEKLKL